jgi:pimeloyl-ACP methyl ester carboxylesterase
MIVFIHGLWLTGIESTWLRHRLAAELHCDTHAFHYPSVTATLSEVVDSLQEFIVGLHADTLHLIGHSLGGIVVLRLLETHNELPMGRVVLLGSPVAGSRVAQGLARWRLGAAIMGRTVEEELLHSRPRRWDGRRELGIIAGNQPLGLGRLVSELTEPNDGTIAVSETQLLGATEHIVLPVSHIGMLFSAEVAQQTAHFLQSGCFARSIGGSG